MPNGEVFNVEDGPKDMVSFNHYAYGAVGNWLYRGIGGLTMLEPGYRKFRLAPLVGAQLDWAEVSHICPYGRIACRWEKKASGTYGMTFSVPEGCEALVACPDGSSRSFGAGEWSI